ncbi:hypothetical protein EMCRGX_G008310 [Ephydatia muelleri]
MEGTSVFFLNPSSDLDQLNRILNIVGSHSAEDLSCIMNDKASSHQTFIAFEIVFLILLSSVLPSGAAFQANCTLYLGLVYFQWLTPRPGPPHRMLCFNPNTRITVEDVLTHEYLMQHYDPSDEPVADRKCMIFEEINTFCIKSQDSTPKLLSTIVPQAQGPSPIFSTTGHTFRRIVVDQTTGLDNATYEVMFIAAVN